jgi:competence protein ComFC
MENFKRQTITGAWCEGYCLDFHIIRSECTGYNQAGHPQFRTDRTEIGELLYRLKYCSDRSVVTELAAAAEQLLKAWKPRVDVIVPVPPSRQRALPPVLVLAEAIGKRIGIPVADCLKRKGEIPALKDVSDHDQRLKLLDGLHEVDKSVTRGKRILLFDDLYRSGATMNAITADLYQKGMAKDVFAMTITRTRSNE